MHATIHPLFFAPRIDAIVNGYDDRHPLDDMEKLEDDLADASIIGTVLIVNSNTKIQPYPEYITVSFNGFKCDRHTLHALDPFTIDTCSNK